jgi:hypothetical protein
VEQLSETMETVRLVATDKDDIEQD